MAAAEPSPQDRRVAQEAVQLEAQARQQLAEERAQEQDTQLSRTEKNEPSNTNDVTRFSDSATDESPATEVPSVVNSTIISSRVQSAYALVAGGQGLLRASA